jgi:hypothetical protein
MLKRFTAFVAKWRRRRALRRKFRGLINAKHNNTIGGSSTRQDEAKEVARVLERWRASLSDE